MTQGKGQRRLKGPKNRLSLSFYTEHLKLETHDFGGTVAPHVFWLIGTQGI